MNRRDFLASAPLALAATALPSTEVFAETASSLSSARQNSSPSAPQHDTPSKTAAPAARDLDFATALQAAEAIRTKKVSSVELTERMFTRIDHYNPKLNVFAYQLREDALAQAKKADAALAQNKVSAKPWAFFTAFPSP